MQKLIITVAPTGSLPTKQDTPYVPVTPEEVIQDVYDCYQAGASIVHIHSRDKDQKTTHDLDFFRKTVNGIREKCNIIVQISTSGRAGKGAENRGAALALKPDMASLTTGSVNFPTFAYINEPDLIEYLAERMLEYNIKPELEVFDTSMINNGVQLFKKNLIKQPLYFNFVMGVPGAIPFSPKNLINLVNELPEGAIWNTSGIARAQLQINTLAIVMGGHARVGLEDNIYYSKGVLATNKQLVERIVRIAKEVGREIATPDEARAILGII